MTGDDESCDNSHSLLPAHDSCEVDSLPEDRGKQQGLLPPVLLQFIMITQTWTGHCAIVPLCHGTGAPFDEHRRPLQKKINFHFQSYLITLNVFVTTLTVH